MLWHKIQGAGGVGGGVAVNDIFSTTLYTGTNSIGSVTTGIDVTANGGMSHSYNRDDGDAGLGHTLLGSNEWFQTKTTAEDALITSAAGLLEFTSTGYTVGGNSITWNSFEKDYAIWTFAKSANFFDVVTWTGTGVARTIHHDLGSAPGMIWTMEDASGNGRMYHRSGDKDATPAEGNMLIPIGADQMSALSMWNNTAPTSTEFSLDGSAAANASGKTYYALLFGHDESAGSNIKCGSYIGNNSTNGPVIDLGWEPQYLYIHVAEGSNSVGYVWDNVRSPTNPREHAAVPMVDLPEITTGRAVDFNATGFQLKTTAGQLNKSGSKYVYMAVRKGD
jgi:hypothetical protein